ncbi:MAG: hypothetical protein QXF45_06320 [Candidatus Caldarchaeum sp.]
MTEIVVYIKSSVGKGEVDMRAGKFVITYRDRAVFRENIYPNNSTITAIYQVTGDGDTVLEYGEVWAVKINVTRSQHRAKRRFQRRNQTSSGFAPQS